MLLAQNRAMADWSAVRVALVADPISFTSRKFAVYSALSKAGGPLGSRNCEPLVIAHGVTNCQFGKSGGRDAWRRRNPITRIRARHIRHNVIRVIIGPQGKDGVADAFPKLIPAASGVGPRLVASAMS